MNTHGDFPVERASHPLLRVSEGRSGDEGVLAALPGPALLLDVYGFILASNADGQDLVERHPAFFIERGYLALRRREEAWTLADGLLEASRGAGHAVHLTLFSRTGRPVLLIRLAGVGLGQAETIICTIEDLLSKIEDINRLAAAMGVTGAQARTAAMLAHGLSTAEIADVSGVTDIVVREHIRDVMLKLRLTGQRELIVCTMRMARFLGLMQTSLTGEARAENVVPDAQDGG
jgi:DNA-binding CsgD family transcriptional regulator